MAKIRINLLFKLKKKIPFHIHSCHFSFRLSFPTTSLKITAISLRNLFANSLSPQRHFVLVTRNKLDQLKFPELPWVVTWHFWVDITIYELLSCACSLLMCVRVCVCLKWCHILVSLEPHKFHFFNLWHWCLRVHLWNAPHFTGFVSGAELCQWASQTGTFGLLGCFCDRERCQTFVEGNKCEWKAEERVVWWCLLGEHLCCPEAGLKRSPALPLPR